MSSFSSAWLGLREPVDHASINAELRRQLCQHFAGGSKINVIDLGSGTGSNLRGLAPWLAGADRVQSWTLVDYDGDLLAEAATRASPGAGEITIATQQTDLARADLTKLMAGGDLVTASAFFDLASRDLIERIADAVCAAGAAFYTVLTYDGIASWLPEHPADAAMRDAFNAHQTGDKGLGPALGPAATAALETAFENRGYRTTRAPSPWVVGANHQSLRHELDQGWSSAVADTRSLDPREIENWRTARLEPRTPDNRVTIVGHEDMLALPPA